MAALEGVGDPTGQGVAHGVVMSPLFSPDYVTTSCAPTACKALWWVSRATQVHETWFLPSLSGVAEARHSLCQLHATPEALFTQHVFKEAQAKFSVSPKAPPECQQTHYSAGFRDDTLAEELAGEACLTPVSFPGPVTSRLSGWNPSGQRPGPPEWGQNASSSQCTNDNPVLPINVYSVIRNAILNHIFLDCVFEKNKRIRNRSDLERESRGLPAGASATWVVRGLGD